MLQSVDFALSPCHAFFICSVLSLMLLNRFLPIQDLHHDVNTSSDRLGSFSFESQYIFSKQPERTVLSLQLGEL